MPKGPTIRDTLDGPHRRRSAPVRGGGLGGAFGLGWQAGRELDQHFDLSDRIADRLHDAAPAPDRLVRIHDALRLGRLRERLRRN